MKTLKVKAVGKCLVPNFEAMEQGVLRFIGRVHDASLGVEIPNSNGQRTGGWKPTEEVVEVPFKKEYIDELKAGSLEAADEETAKLIGASFKKKEDKKDSKKE